MEEIDERGDGKYSEAFDERVQTGNGGINSTSRTRLKVLNSA